MVRSRISSAISRGESNRGRRAAGQPQAIEGESDASGLAYVCVVDRISASVLLVTASHIRSCKAEASAVAAKATVKANGSTGRFSTAKSVIAVSARKSACTHVHQDIVASCICVDRAPHRLGNVVGSLSHLVSLLAWVRASAALRRIPLGSFHLVNAKNTKKSIKAYQR